MTPQEAAYTAQIRRVWRAVDACDGIVWAIERLL